ncbi:MAG: hypothetical protein HOP32_10350 [Nitrospira sp.]|nr:hypothetical protein [Nitrospira sp.]
MIKLNRDLSAVPNAFLGGNHQKLQVKLLKAKQKAKAGKVEFDSKVWKAAKEQLKNESRKKCAYCESPTTIVAHGDVEHFRPKSKYWWLAYCYHNYLFACQICNQTFKKDEFPVKSNRGRLRAPKVPSSSSKNVIEQAAAKLAPEPKNEPAVNAYIASVLMEAADLVDPYIEDPEALLAWGVDETLREVSILPMNQQNRSLRAMKAAENYYGLNRDDLRNERFRKYKEIRIYAEVVRKGNLPGSLIVDSQKALKDAMNADAPYAGMARYFIKDIWNVQV